MGAVARYVKILELEQGAPQKGERRDTGWDKHLFVPARLTPSGLLRVTTYGWPCYCVGALMGVSNSSRR